jgi:hypothetical protein
MHKTNKYNNFTTRAFGASFSTNTIMSLPMMSIALLISVNFHFPFRWKLTIMMIFVKSWIR